MMRTLTIAAIAVAAVLAVSITEASARRGGGVHTGGFRGFHSPVGRIHVPNVNVGRIGHVGRVGHFPRVGHVGRIGTWRGAHWRGHRWHHHRWHHRHFARFFGVPAFYFPYAYHPLGAPTCTRSVRVKTRYGVKWRRVWVCG